MGGSLPVASRARFDGRDGRTGQAWTPTQRAKNTVIYWWVRMALALADAMPAGLLVRLGRLAGTLAYYWLPRSRQVAVQNLRQALGCPDAPRVARRCFRNAGGNLGVTLLLRRSTLRALDLVSVSPQTLALLRDTLAGGRGAVFVSAHLGPFELIPAVVAELGYSPAVVVRESYDARLDPLVDQHRCSRGIQVIHRGRKTASLSLLRALRTGRPVGLLPDLGGRVPSAPGVLLGQPVPLPVGPQRIASLANCPVLVGTLGPLRGGESLPGRWPAGSLPRFELTLTRLWAPDELVLGRRIAQTLTEHIRASAEHWLWMAPRFRLLQHNRA